jgi:membrane protein required for colicin V production
LNWLDIILLAILGVTTALGIFKGFVKQFFGLLTLIIGLILAFSLYSQASWFYLRVISSRVLAQFLGFLTVFLAVECLGLVASHLFSKLMKGPLKLLNNVLGGVLGLIKGILICGVVVFVLLVFPVNKNALKESWISPACLSMSKAVVNLIPRELREKFKEAYQEITKRVEKNGKRI